MRSVSPLSNTNGFWHHTRMLQESAGSSRYLHI